MKEFTYVIKEELGLHARPAGLLVKEAKKFQSATTLAAKGKTAAAGKLIAIMSMGVKQGDEVTVQVEGPDEDAAFEALEKFFQENLYSSIDIESEGTGNGKIHRKVRL